MRWLKQLFRKNDLLVLDANVVLRYFLNDDKALAERSRDIVEHNHCFIFTETVAEIVYVMDGLYKIPRKEIRYGILNLPRTISFDKPSVIATAMDAYISKPKMDFADCILYGYAKHGYRVVTFDKKLKKKIEKV